MRTIIRLRRFGEKNVPKYKLIVQGHYKRLKGRYIEHLGYWFPVDNKEHGRSIILNKGRLRFWIGNGAVYSPKVQKLLNFMDLSTVPWVPFGRQTLYKSSGEQSTRLSDSIKKFINKSGENGLKERFESLMRAHDDENILLRRVKFQRSIGQYVDEKEEIVDDNGVIEDDIKTRTEKFLRLKKIYDEIEAKDPLLSPLKREILYRKMNELASKGLMIESDQANSKTPSEDAIVNLYEERQKKAYNNLIGAINLFEPISREEFMEVARIQVIDKDIDFIMEEFLEEQKETGKPLTKADMHIFCKIYNAEDDVEMLTPEQIKNEEKDFIPPTRYPLTPFPDFEDYDPKDWFDLNDDNLFNINQNYKGEDKWFDLPLTKRRREMFEEKRNKEFLNALTSKSRLNIK